MVPTLVFRPPCCKRRLTSVCSLAATLTLVSFYYLNTTQCTENASACAAGLAGSTCKAIREYSYVEKSPYREKCDGMLAKSNEELVDILVRALASSLKLWFTAGPVNCLGKLSMSACV